MTVGYARVPTVDQNPEYQLRALEERGCERIFTDHCPGACEAPPAARRGLRLPARR